MRFLTLDSETTKAPHMSPWDDKAYLCSWCLEEGELDKEDDYLSESSTVYFFNHVDGNIQPHDKMIKQIQSRIDNCDLLVFHNSKFDLSWLIHMGIKFDHKPVWCTMIGDYCLYGQNPNISYSLNACAERRKLGSKYDAMADFWNNGYETDEIPRDIHEKYVKQDVHLTKQLFLRQYHELEKGGMFKICRVSMELSKMLAHMEYYGLKFDKEQALIYAEEFKQKVEDLRNNMFKVVGYKFLTTSPSQLEAVMYGGNIKREVKELVAKQRKDGSFRVYTRKGEMLIPVGLGFKPHEHSLNAKTGRYSTGKKARALLRPETEQQRDFLRILNDISKTQKIISTLVSTRAYDLLSDEGPQEGLVSKVDSRGFLHPQLNQTVTVTGRLSSSNPNGQNLPRGSTSPLKKLIKPRNGIILNADLSQIEWRNAACLSKDRLMMDELWHGFDVHTDRAERSFGGKDLDHHSKEFKTMRNHSKVFNFRMIYGGTAKAFFYDGDMPDFPLEQYEHIVQDFYDKYARLREWQLENFEKLKKQKYLRNPSGRILTFKYNTNPEEGAIGYSLQRVCNYPVQSFSADCMLVAMYEIWKKLQEKGFKSIPILQVHDSIVFDTVPSEAYDIAKLCSDVMCDIPNLIKKYFNFEMGIPIACEVGIGPDYGTLPWEFKPEEIKKETFSQISLLLGLTKAIEVLFEKSEGK